jgi:hypothetical protein
LKTNSFTRMITATVTLTVLASGAIVLAQDPKPAAGQKTAANDERAQMITVQLSGGPGGPGNAAFAYSEMSFESEMVKGAPYSAQATSSTVQTLGDGNKITRQTSGMVYRDSEGRTRREQNSQPIGGGAASQVVFINDPVSKTNYILSSQDHSAQKMPFRTVTLQTKSGGSATNQVIESGLVAEAERHYVQSATIHGESSSGLDPATATTVVMPPPPLLPPGPEGQFMVIPDGGSVAKNLNADFKTESLGTQTFEGVQAEGTRTTATIPAGAIGNELPIATVTEKWYSAELHAVVMFKRTDPRMGETTYQLTNINKSEPQHSLFEVPAEYTVREFTPRGGRAIKVLPDQD